ncbi:cyclic nucleotide-gated channel beta-1 isoform X4 [Tenebrio molitor]|uniref:cyclic nucleotide-gated channel beta-1 isoform X4 n=1 Tax=Tenebrio molitor TaxID=7067 RepID=UPI003624938D
MKLSVSAYRAHASAHKKILDTAYQLNYGSTSASSHQHAPPVGLPTCSAFQIDPPSGGNIRNAGNNRLMADDGSSDDANTPLQSPRSQNTSREEDDSSNANESDCKSPSQRTKSNQRWMKLRTTVQISSAMQKKPPLKREDSFLKRFSSRQIPETQETVEDTGSEGVGGDSHSAPRRRRRPRKQPRTVVNPDENFYFYWLLVLTVCVLYNMWTLIVRQSFPELQTMVSNFWLSCDSLSDLVFLLDLLVQLRTGYLEQGLMVYDSKKLACHYLRSRAFLFDLAALCPLDLLQIRLGAQPLLRCPRFLKVYRAVNYYYMVESRTVWPNLWRVVNLIHILLILAHWFGCFYFLLSEAEGFQGDWVYPYRPGDYATLTRKYLGSLYWSTLTLTTIGDLPTPETNAEKTNSVDGPRSLPRRGIKSRLLQFNTNNGYIFTIVSYLIGVFIFATIVGQVGNVITNRNANRLEFERLLDGAKTYMRHHKVPGGMKRRVLRWYDYSWSRGRIQGGGDINTALGLLPDKLKTELALHVNLSVLKKVTIFQECQPEFLRDLVLKMKAYIFTPGDSICRKGEVAREMFIIADGILEVISEHGKVLTTMKAGDFFGEIGILNLDGLNKRTADVRSVGYSELFSLSREDVLAAMKDYPEAQEILQALGRKRLMEVKASARNPPHHKEHHHGIPHVPDPKGLVDKIKNEAKGLRNALKKSRTHRKSDESLELQPLHAPTNNNNKGTLKRMSRVKSHDLSQEENDKKEAVAEPVISPLGAGLPLLHRLRLLKEKQENEERAKSATPPVLSPSSSSVKSPPPIPEDVAEPAGAGLPLLQRILMLKAKEGTTKEEKPKLSRTGSVTSNPTSPTPQTSRASFSAKIPNNKLSFRERLKLHSSIPKDASSTDVKEPSISASDSVSESDKNEPPWSKLKKAAISRDSSDPSTSAPPSRDSVTTVSVSDQVHQKPKPKLVITARTKQYRSIDDLSPEYGGLPFVKKLKILNERQKLEELETVMKTRSFSLDIPDTGQTAIEMDTLTRSRSEGSKMHHDKNLLSTPNELHSSNESNETPERRNLRSILKKLSEETQLPQPPVTMPKKIDSTEFRKLMRAPTIEGYAARHSKLSKSVTFNRDTLQSPPNSALLMGAPSLFSFVNSSEKGDAATDQDNQIVTNKTNNQVKLIKNTLDDEQQYFADILLAIKQVMSAHLQDLQQKFYQRFEKLEEEVRSRDEIIDQLKSHICELEKSAEESTTDSFETVVSKAEQQSWEDTSHEEAEEIHDLPQHPLSPLHAWRPLPEQNVVLDIDSTTDTEGDSSEQSGEFENSGNNWEIEMLAAQMRQKRSRSASLDCTAKPLRRRFTRGGSAEARND